MRRPLGRSIGLFLGMTLAAGAGCHDETAREGEADAPDAHEGDAGPSDASSPADAPAHCATGGSALWNDLQACGWPSAETTGPPAGMDLAATSGRTITADGTVIDGERITGGLVIAATGVVVRNSWITNAAGGGGGTAVVRVEPGASATIEGSLLDGLNDTHACLWHEGTSVVARRNHLRGCNDGVFSWLGDGFTVEGNYVHELTTEAANGHIDGFQTEGGSHGVIRHNVFDIVQEQNAAVALWNSLADTDDVLVEDNLLAGSGFIFYAEDYSPSEASPEGGFSLTRVRFLDNKLSTIHFGCVGYWGVWYPRGDPTDAWERSGNRVLETGEAVDEGNPTFMGATCN